MAWNPALELGETFLDGAWECDDIDELHFRLLSSPRTPKHQHNWRHHLRTAWAFLINPQSRARAGRVAQQHYDRTPELFRHMLDAESMSYTCAFWRDPDTLGSAQREKLRMICDKLALREGETLLDIGCGFGGLASFAAENYGARVFGITNSRMHLDEARRRCAHLPGVELALLDYRELPSLRRRFDKAASIEMIEAVGPKNYRRYMKIVEQLVRGQFVVQAFISDTSEQVCNEWFDRHIFPNGVSPSLAQLDVATRGSFGRPRDVEQMGRHYPPTLLAWHANLEAAWDRVPEGASKRSRRLWRFYLHSLAGVFRAGDLRLCQLVYSR
jgi:cyclopropane-fatty-acyl-phospholipid synthase